MLSQERLKEIRVQVSRLRETILRKAKSEMLKDGTPYSKTLYEVSRLAKKILNRTKYMERQEAPDAARDFAEPVAPGLRKTVRKKKHLDVSERVRIVHQVVVEKQM